VALHTTLAPVPPSMARSQGIGAAVAIALHLGLLWAVLNYHDMVQRGLLNTLPATLLPAIKPPPPPPPKIQPVLKTLTLPPMSLPVIEVPKKPPPPERNLEPPRFNAPRFGAADGNSLAIDLQASNTGGASSRVDLGDYDGELRKRIARARVNPTLPPEVRHNCMIEYTVTVDDRGHLLRYSIEPCTVEQFNQAARHTIESIGVFPVPPHLGGGSHVVHGTLNYQLKVTP